MERFHHCVAAVAAAGALVLLERAPSFPVSPSTRSISFSPPHFLRSVSVFPPSHPCPLALTKLGMCVGGWMDVCGEVGGCGGGGWGGVCVCVCARACARARPRARPRYVRQAGGLLAWSVEPRVVSWVRFLPAVVAALGEEAWLAKLRRAGERLV